MTFEVYLSIGSNIQPDENITETILAILEFTEIRNLSSVYLTKPIQLEDGADEFHNLCVSIATDRKPGGLKNRLKSLENNVGRERSEGDKELYESRKVDVDILLYDPEPEGFEPHQQIYDEAYVIYPLSDIYDPARREDLPDSSDVWRSSSDSDTIIDQVEYDWPSRISC